MGGRLRVDPGLRKKNDENDNYDDDYNDDADGNGGGSFPGPYAPVSRSGNKVGNAASGLRVRALAVDSGDEQEAHYGLAVDFDPESRYDSSIRRSVEMDDLYSGAGSSSHHETSDWTQQTWSFGASALDTLNGTHNSPGSNDTDVDGDALTATGSDHQNDDHQNGDKMSLGTQENHNRLKDYISFLESAEPGDAHAHTHAHAHAAGSVSPLLPPPADEFMQANMDGIQQQVWAQKDLQVHSITMSDDSLDAESVKAVDIHLGDDEGIMDDYE